MHEFWMILYKWSSSARDISVYYQEDSTPRSLTGKCPHSQSCLEGIDVLLGKWRIRVDDTFPIDAFELGQAFNGVTPEAYRIIFDGEAPQRHSPTSRPSLRRTSGPSEDRSTSVHILEKVPGHPDSSINNPKLFLDSIKPLPKV